MIFVDFFIFFWALQVPKPTESVLFKTGRLPDFGSIYRSDSNFSTTTTKHFIPKQVGVG
jgi:hypothetical protein